MRLDAAKRAQELRLSDTKIVYPEKEPAEPVQRLQSQISKADETKTTNHQDRREARRGTHQELDLTPSPYQETNPKTKKEGDEQRSRHTALDVELAQKQLAKRQQRRRQQQARRCHRGFLSGHSTRKWQL